MYSPDISDHTPELYKLAQEQRRPMTVIAKRLIEFGLERKEEVFSQAASCCNDEQSNYYHKKD